MTLALILIELASFSLLAMILIATSRSFMEALNALIAQVSDAQAKLAALQDTSNKIVVLVSTPDVTDQQLAAVTAQVKQLADGIAAVNTQLVAALPPAPVEA